MSSHFSLLPKAAEAGGTVRPRLTDLIMLMADLFAGQEIRSGRIKKLLTPGEWQRFSLLMHGPSLPVTPSTKTLNYLYAYRQRLKKTDDLYRIANARKRNKTMIGPDLFRQAETAYAVALESLEELLGDHPYIADYLSPYPDFSNWRIRSTQCGMPRLRNTIAAAPERIYSRETGEEYVLSAIEILRGIAHRELRKLKRSKAARDAVAPR